MEKNFFVKAHGLGNDYIVFDSETIGFQLTTKTIIKICDVHYGIGSDGILLKVPSEKADFGVKIYNPDGSEAEKSGNGLRIFSKFIYDYKYTDNTEFTIETLGGIVHSKIIGIEDHKAHTVKVEMGKANFIPAEIPVLCHNKECLGELVNIEEHLYKINCVSVGNPHCVIFKDTLEEEEIKKNGTLIENHSIFPNRINVQFAKVINRNLAQVLIWERGAGYTLASGSSACAVAAILVKLGKADSNICIEMPGGKLDIEVGQDWSLKMTGEVKETASGILSKELVKEL